MASRDPARPNVILIISDDQGPWALGSVGNEEIATPNLDRLASRGTRFTNFFCTSPVCSPARASLLTGRIPSAHGIHDALWGGNFGDDSIELLEGQEGYTDLLAAAGYDCAISGKWHLGASDRPQKSFKHWFVLQGGGSNYHDVDMFRGGQPEKTHGYATDVFTDDAIEVLVDSSANDRPLFLSLCYTAPHSPFLAVHPQEWLDYYSDCEFASCPQEPEHPWTRSRDQNFPQYNLAHDDPPASLRGYFAAVSAMDANIGRVVTKVDELQMSASTLIVFVSDNGFNAGHHGVWGKGNGTYPQNMYDNSVRVPAIACHPGRVPAGAVRDELVCGYDLRPTLLDYVGVADSTKQRLPGRTFAPMLLGRSGGREHVIVYSEYGPTRMVRTQEWKYVHRYPVGPHELYHLSEDPDERVNLFDEIAHHALRRDLRARLASWFVEFADPSMDGTKEAVTGRGQVGLVGPAGRGAEAFLPERW